MVTSIETAKVVEAYRETCEDRVEVIVDGDRTLIVVADGAGGTGDGHLAAEMLLRETRLRYASINESTGWSKFLAQVDFTVTPGETTAVIVDIHADRILGASVGDSCAWVVDGPNVTDLTRTQVRKPLLGSKSAKPAPFWHGPLEGTLLVGTDGFFNYAKQDQVIRLIATTDFYVIPRACIDLVRLPSGELWDDTAIVACRTKRPARSRRRFSIG